ncbi:hypothetical protein QE152_g41138 [Popillia japonica]|uniref:Uncharacterized protein n=1 Tax=Popillia japonica TaxID=7064 RepID=A0AAW1H436_POPJA
MLSFGITILLFLLSLIFKVAGKLRLTMPVIYFLLISTVLNKWAAANEKLSLAILLGLIGLTLISWLFSLKNVISDRRYARALEADVAWQINRAREGRKTPFDYTCDLLPADLNRFKQVGGSK